MNTMADGAAQRLVAQIGEALFGQPGLDLMELAEKVKVSQPSPAGQDALTQQQVCDRFGFLEGLVTEATYRRIADEAFRIQQEALAARQPMASNQSSGNSGQLGVDGQPVGQEPVAHEYTFAGLGKRDSVAFIGPEYKPAAPKGMQLVAVRPLYYQTAQAVDLEMVERAMLAHVGKHATRYVIDDLRALIDGKEPTRG